jgi:hypothetical protein
VLVPYSTYQVVAWPFGFTAPVTVADVGPTDVTGPVIAIGAGAVAAPPPATVASVATAVRTPTPRDLRMAAALLRVVSEANTQLR